MKKIVDINVYKFKAAEKRGFEDWNKRFNASYGSDTRLSDLSDRTILELAGPGEEHAMLFYELIMGILNLGHGAKFYYLENKKQIRVIDIHLFLADQTRFELMRRLEWVNAFHCGTYRLIEMVEHFDDISDVCKKQPPCLSPYHPQYDVYKQLTGMDREMFIRRLIPDAIEKFEKNMELSPHEPST